VFTVGGFRNRPEIKYGKYGAKALSSLFILPVSDLQHYNAVKTENKRIKEGK
jgi:hypothetical protein